jgi:hypothetical protein
MEVLYNPATWEWDRNTVLEMAKLKLAEINREQEKKFEQAVRDGKIIPNPDKPEEYNYDERIELGHSMLDYYGTKVMPVVDDGWKPLRVEVEFLVAIQNPDTGEYLYCKCDQCWARWVKYWDGGRGDLDPAITTEEDLKRMYRPDWEGLPVCLGGRLDMLCEDQFGDLWIVDWKTAARMSKDTDAFLYLDDQIGSYVMALRRKLGLNVRGFVYVELRKAQVAAPKKNKVQRLGRWFSVNKQQAVTAELYIATVSEEDPEAYEAGLYDEFISFIEGEGMEFHRRYQIMKTDVELLEIERMIWLEAQDMIDPNLRIYPNPGRFNCQFCAFRQPCLGMYDGSDFQYLLDETMERRTKHYWEEKIKSTDSRGGE